MRTVTTTHEDLNLIKVFINQSHSRPGQPWGIQEVEAPRFQDSLHMKVVRLSALCTSRLYPPGNIPGIHFCWRLSRPQRHSEAERIMSVKNSNDTIGNRTRYLPAFSAVPQPTALPRVSFLDYKDSLKFWTDRIRTAFPEIFLRLLRAMTNRLQGQNKKMWKEAEVTY